MSNLIRNAWQMARAPWMIAPYARWAAPRVVGEQPLVRLPDGAVVGEFNSFSEYLLRRQGVPTDVRALMRARLQSSPTLPLAVDVGGNLGIFALTLAGLGYHQVHTFEPVPATYARLAANLRRNVTLAARITANNCAVGERAGNCVISYDWKRAGQAAMRAGCTESAGVALSVPLVTLDEYCRDRHIERIDFLKIDVEGLEVAVLRGARELLQARRVGAVYTEIIRKALTDVGTTPEELYHDLSGMGYFPYATGPAGAATRRLRADEIADRSEAHRNVLWLVDAGDEPFRVR